MDADCAIAAWAVACLKPASPVQPPAKPVRVRLGAMERTYAGGYLGADYLLYPNYLKWAKEQGITKTHGLQTFSPALRDVLVKFNVIKTNKKQHDALGTYIEGIEIKTTADLPSLNYFLDFVSLMDDFASFSDG